MRRAMVVTTCALAAMALALPAHAKFAGTAYISGPGIPGGSGSTSEGEGGGTIRVDGSHRADYRVLSALASPARSLTSRPTGDLGPRYEARLVITAPDGQSDVVHRLYPFAEAGAVLYTPPYQEFFELASGHASSGWSRAPAKLMRELRDRGLPTTPRAPLRPADGAAVKARSTPDPTGWDLVPVGGLLVAGALVGRRRRRRAQGDLGLPTSGPPPRRRATGPPPSGRGLRHPSRSARYCSASG